MPDSFLYKLKENNPIENIMSSYTNLIRQGHDYVCLCPFHSEKTASCRVYTNDQHFYCYGCGAGGDVITFIKRIENIEYMEAVRFLAEKSGMEVPDDKRNNYEANLRKRIYELNREAARFYYKNLISGSDKRGLMYFAQRKLKPETIKKYGLGFAPDGWDTLAKHLMSLGFTENEIIAANLGRKSRKNNMLYDSFRNRVIFPIFDLRGNIIAFGGRVLDDSLPKYINSSDTPVFKKSRNLFSLNFAKNSSSKRLILAEGYMDVIALNQAGFENAVATLGTAITPEHARIMANYAKEVIIAYDSDSAGQNAAHKAINLLGSVGITAKVIKMEGAKDPDEYIKKNGSDKFRMLLNNSQGAVNFEIDKCRIGLDIASETDKVEFLRRTTRMLADIVNPLERNVYISKIANECDINTEIIKASVDSIIRKKYNEDKKSEWQAVRNMQIMHDRINPEADTYPKEARAEEMIIVYLFRNPEMLEDIKKKISPNKFVTAFNRRIYDCLCRKLKDSGSFSMSLFSDEFNNDEMGRITGLDIKNKEIDVNDETVSDCIRVLDDCCSDSVSSEFSDDDLLKLQQKLINTKQED
ncbi:MAG: DNA primase [Oscillospiraceae bacterium]